MNDWYIYFSQFTIALGQPFFDLAAGVDIPLLVALLLGIAGAMAPCQVSVNLGAFGYISRSSGHDTMPLNQAFGFIAGKIAVYSTIGILLIVLGSKAEQFPREMIPLFQIGRKVMGPLFLMSGLFLIGVFRFQGSVGEKVKEKLLRFVPVGGIRGSFWLGVVFSLTFCPTLFLIFFGTLIPLGIRSTGGVFLPAVFAFGNALPLLVLTTLLVIGSEQMQKRFRRTSGQLSRVMTKVAGVFFILLGVNDTLLYWIS